MNKRRKLKITLISIALVVAIIVTAVAIYLGSYYRADEDAIAAYEPINEVEYSTLQNGSIVFTPEKPIAGFIFYPGGKVENDAYKPLMAALASRGVLCVLTEMPLNLAVFDINAAEGIQEQYPEITDWYIGGHSLGGSMAASYLEKHAGEYKGLVLLGSYSTADLSKSDLAVLCIHGSEDKVMNREKHDEYKTNLPDSTIDFDIEGGNHAGFGMYGEQKGDGAATVSQREQIRITAYAIIEIILRNK
jgi:dienelactone hydrolase